MMRACVLAMCLLAALASDVHALDGTLTAPQLAKPTSPVTEGDALHAKYEAAWTRYEEAVAKVTAGVNKRLDDLFNQAADAGNLDLADMWDKRKKSFSDTKTLEWPSDGKAKTEWRKKFSDIEFPEDFSEAVKTAQAGYADAVADLKEDYEALVKEYTKERNLGRAKQLRDEVAGLERKPVAQPERPKAIEIKPEAKPTVMALRELPQGYNAYPWVSADGLRLYWNRGEGGWRAIWCADRLSPDAAFGNQRRLFEAADPSLTEDEMEIFVTGTKLTVMTAKRQAKGGAFGPLQALPELASLGKTVRPCVSPDGLMLWFDKVGDDESTRWKNQVTLRVIRRSRAAPWGQPEEVRKDEIGMSNGFFIRPKEQYGIFPKDAGFVFAVTRDAGQSFLNPVRLEIPVDTPSGKQPFYCPATRELFFTGHTDAASGGDSLIYVVKDLDLPSTKK